MTKKKYSFKCLTFSSFLSNIWHIYSLWMIISTIFLGIWGYSEIFIYGNIFCLQNTSAEGLKLFLCLVRGCPFIKIWFNGSIRTSFTESYLDGLSHVWGSPTKIDKNSWSDWAMWWKDSPWHLKVDGYKLKIRVTIKEESVPFFVV